MPASSHAFDRDFKAAKPSRNLFDAWNSSSTGHQRAENRLSGSTAWRDSRTAKLAVQLADDSLGGGRRVADTVGAGSLGFGVDGRREDGSWERGGKGLRSEGQLSLLESTRGAELGSEKAVDESAAKIAAASDIADGDDEDDAPPSAQPLPAAPPLPSTISKPIARPPQVFANLTLYINGSTHPLISDHKLKRLLASHGGRVALGLARRSVTHVVLGEPNGASSGAGGGLAAGKIQKEVAVARNGVRFVGVRWVLECVRRGKRVAEAPFAVVRTAGAGQRGVADMFTKKS